jgi:hypothetical protein
MTKKIVGETFNGEKWFGHTYHTELKSLHVRGTYLIHGRLNINRESSLNSESPHLNKDS